MEDGTGPPDEAMGADRLRRLASSLRQLGSAGDIDATLQHIVELAVESVEGADLADIMLVRAGQVSTPFATDQTAAELDRAQQEIDEGPCVLALRDQDTVVAHDLERDNRWPEFTPRALGLGVRSIAAYRLFRTRGEHEDRYGTLSLFGTRPGFEDHELDLGEVLAAHCSAVLSAAIDRDGAEVARLAREIIGQAKGILMVRHELNPDQAYAMLRRAAAHHDIPIDVLASEVVAGTTTLRP